jgi:microcystin degradation protein MlrC
MAGPRFDGGAGARETPIFKAMKISMVALMQEVNTFTALRSSLEDWEIGEGAGAFESAPWNGANAARGAWEVLRCESDVELHPGLFAIALPGGPLDSATGADLVARVARSVTASGKPDGVLLVLHGSMLYEGEFDAEGVLAELVRREVGPNIPIVAALDMHAKFTRRLEDNIDGVTAYKTAPHTDEMQTGVAAARMLLDSLRSGVAPVCRSVHLPMMLSGEKSETHASPMSDLIAAARSWENEAGIVSADLLLGFPWADTPHAGIFCVASGFCPQNCEKAAADLAKRFWEARHSFDFTTPALEPEEAIAMARDTTCGPLFLSDSGDNPTAGAGQNMTWFLWRLETEAIGPCLVPAIADPTAYQLAAAAEPGVQITIPIGTTVHGKTVPMLFRCAVDSLHVHGRVRVAVLKGKYVTCLVTDRRVGTLDLSMIRSCGIEVRDYRCVIVKCGYQGPECRAAASKSFLVLTPGDTNARLEKLPYHKIPRPMWPMDNEN